MSRYLYRGVINERDLISFDQARNTVTFRYIDSKTRKPCLRTLSLSDFLWRIMMQVLPKGFRRVRDNGYLHSKANTRLALLQVLLHVQLPPPAIKIAVQYHCAQCQGGMRIVGFLKPG